MELKVFWWRKSAEHFNIGDEITKDVVEFVSRAKVVKASAHEAELFAIGSVLQRALAPAVLAKRSTPLTIWGSGLKAPQAVAEHPLVDYALVRGPITRAMCPVDSTLAVGDPGMMVSKIWASAPERRYRLGIVPHYTQINAELFQRLADRVPRSVVIDVSNPDKQATLATLSSCDFIAASSLHGLIFADSYGIPSAWMKTRDTHEGKGFKFYDHFAAVGRLSTEPVDFHSVADGRRAFSEQDFQSAHLVNRERVIERIAASLPQKFRKPF